MNAGKKKQGRRFMVKKSAINGSGVFANKDFGPNERIKLERKFA